jgi:hypothetical protein
MDTTNSGVTDDQELAKVLESMNQQTSVAPVVPASDDQAAPAASDGGLSFEETSAQPAVDSAAPIVAPTIPEPSVAVPSSSPELDSIKKSALEELRPLVDKLDLPADEKFDTLLLIIRSTDDKSLVTAAHEAAKAITDETKRAQALLDVIKEIDYFSGHGANPAV